jgi:hypothetical protein
VQPGEREAALRLHPGRGEHPEPQPGGTGLNRLQHRGLPDASRPRTSRPPPRQPARSSTSLTTRSSRSRPNKVGAVMSPIVPARQHPASRPARTFPRSPRPPSHPRHSQAGRSFPQPRPVVPGGAAATRPAGAPRLPSQTTEAAARSRTVASAPVPVQHRRHGPPGGRPMKTGPLEQATEAAPRGIPITPREGISVSPSSPVKSPRTPATPTSRASGFPSSSATAPTTS